MMPAISKQPSEKRKCVMKSDSMTANCNIVINTNRHLEGAVKYVDKEVLHSVKVNSKFFRQLMIYIVQQTETFHQQYSSSLR